MNKLLLTLCMLLTTAPAFAQERNVDPDERRAREERAREEPRDRTNWEAEYKAYLKGNPSVAKAVESGKISKEKVMAGVKERAAEAKEAKLKALYERMKREDPGWARVTFEQARQRLEYVLREEEAAKGDPWEAKSQVFLRQNPALRESFTHGLKKENVIRMLKHGDAKLDESDKAAQQARSEKALKAALKIMTDTKELKPEQAKQIYDIVFIPTPNWEAKYKAYLKENPTIASAVESGKITKETVLAGIKAREGEKPLTEEEKIEALYQKLLREDRTLGRTPKERLMPQLKKMLTRGEAENLRPEQSFRSRQMKFGQTFSNLIESGQVERFDKGLQLVFDFGITEIVRQSGTQREDQRRGEDERVRDERARDRERIERSRDQ